MHASVTLPIRSMSPCADWNSKYADYARNRRVALRQYCIGLAERSKPFGQRWTHVIDTLDFLPIVLVHLILDYEDIIEWIRQGIRWN